MNNTNFIVKLAQYNMLGNDLDQYKNSPYLYKDKGCLFCLRNTLNS
jgi:hypothetical protein